MLYGLASATGGRRPEAKRRFSMSVSSRRIRQRTRRSGRLIVAVGAAVTVLTPAASQAAQDPASTTITIGHNLYVTSDGRTVEKIPQAIVGANQRWPDDGKGIWNTAADRPADNVVR